VLSEAAAAADRRYCVRARGAAVPVRGKEAVEVVASDRVTDAVAVAAEAVAALAKDAEAAAGADPAWVVEVAVRADLPSDSGRGRPAAQRVAARRGAVLRVPRRRVRLRRSHHHSGARNR
jgi:hypothetical protein